MLAVGGLVIALGRKTCGLDSAIWPYSRPFEGSEVRPGAFPLVNHDGIFLRINGWEDWIDN